jgi:hypothetical protein
VVRILLPFFETLSDSDGTHPATSVSVTSVLQNTLGGRCQGAQSIATPNTAGHQAFGADSLHSLSQHDLSKVQWHLKEKR